MPRRAPHRSPSPRLVGVAPLALALACAAGPQGTTEGASEASGASSTGPAGEPAELVIADAWEQVDGASDPLADHRPDPVECGLAGIFVESGELEIDTNFCNYAMVVQPGLVPVPAGSTLTIKLRHYDLTAAAPASAHVALLIGGEIVWEKMIVIPGPAEVISVDVPAPTAQPAGVPVHFHLHNHGQNNWILTGVTVTP
ncbi:MAG: hypothetical protein H6710_01455 [Myxococcales bacterium]|nr:hypothetical protein [Myxococcales bacterium]